MLRGLLTMNTNELERLAVVRKLVDKHLTQVVAAKHLGLTVRQVKRLVKKYVTPHVIPNEVRDLPAVAETFEKHSSLGF